MIFTGVPKPQSCEKKPTYQQHHKCTRGKLTIPLVCFYQQQLAEKERIPKAEEGHQRRKSRCADAKLGGEKEEKVVIKLTNTRKKATLMFMIKAV